MSRKPTVRIVSATEAKNRFGALIKHAYSEEEHLIVERRGIPVVAIVPMQDYARLVAAEESAGSEHHARANSSEAAISRARLKAFLAEAHRHMPDVAEEEVDQDIQEAITAIRKRT